MPSQSEFVTLQFISMMQGMLPNSTMYADACRMINAFARDDGLPKWLLTSYVDSRGVPLGSGEPLFLDWALSISCLALYHAVAISGFVCEH